MIVVDTNVWSETLRSEPNRQVLEWFRTNAAELHMPALVAHELVFGVYLLPDGARRERLAGHVEAMIGRLTDRILPYDVDTAAVHAQLRAAARRSGQESSAQDGQIAAHAVQHDAPLATRNTGDFNSVGLTLINPWGDEATR